MQPAQIVEKDRLDAALQADGFLLFKHSLTCGISARAFSEYTGFVAAHPGVPTGWIDVVGHRPWSQGVAAATGVPHASPQALWIRNGKVVWHASHHRITKESLASATSS